MDFFEAACNVVDRPFEVKTQSEFWSKDDPTMHEGIVVQGGMWEHQRAWWDMDNFVKLLVGGYGSGKTNAGCKRLIALALENAPCTVAAISPSFPIARQTVIATISELLQGKRSIYGSQFWWKYNSSIHEFRIRFHGREAHIVCYSGDRPLSLRGPNLAAAFIDEPFIQEEEVFTQMIARVRHPLAKKKEIVMAGTPEQLNWGYDICMGDKAEKNDVGIIQASTRLNLALDTSYVDRLEGAFSERAAAAYIEGKFINLAEGLVYYSFELEENVVELPYPDDYYELGAGMDFNVNPMAACVFWRRGGHIHVVEEFELRNADTEFMCSTLKDKYWDKGLRDVYPDASGKARHTNTPGGKSDFYIIKEAGFTIKSKTANPKRKDRYNAVNSKLKARNGLVSMTIDPSCKKMIKYFTLYAHETIHKQENFSHLLDAMGYPVAYLFPVDKQTLMVKKLMGL